MEWPSWWSSIPADFLMTPVSLIRQEYIPTGIPLLDFSISGGLLPGNIYEISGEAGSGKTNLSLEILKSICTSCKAYYLSTQKPISQSRLHSIGLNTDHLYIRHSSSSEEIFEYLFHELYQILHTNENLKIVVIDNIYSLVQECNPKETHEKTSIFWRLATVMKYLSFTYKLGIIIINNVVSDMKGHVVPALGLNWSNCINHRWTIEKTHKNRVLTIVQNNLKPKIFQFLMSIDNSSVQLFEEIQ